MRFVLLTAFSALLFGCVNTHEISSQIQGKEGVTIVDDAQGNKIVESFEVQGSSKRDADVGLCVAQNVENKSVVLTGSHSSFVGPYTGRYYSTQSERETGGGEVISYVSEDRKAVTANGTTGYQKEIGNYSIRYLLTTKIEEDNAYLTFKPIEQTALSSGTIPNSGYHKVGAWDFATPNLVIGALEDVANNVLSCLNQ